MKKLFAILAVSGILVACNDSGKTEEPKADTAAVSAPAPDTTLAPQADTTVKADSTAPKVDSAAKH